MEEEAGYKIGGEVTAMALAEVQGEMTNGKRMKYRAEVIVQGYVPVGSGEVLKLQGEYVTFRNANGKSFCMNHEVEPNCSVIVTNTETIQQSSPIKTDCCNNIKDKMAFWRSAADGTSYYIDRRKLTSVHSKMFDNFIYKYRIQT